MTSDPTDTTSRRAHRRVRLPLQVAYRTTGAFLVSYSVDLSRGGLFVETASPSPVGTELELRLEIPGVTRDVTLRGIVVWTQGSGAGGHVPGMGVQFQDVEQSIGDLIDTLVRQWSGLRILVASASARTRAQLVRLLRSNMAAAIEEQTLEVALPATGPAFDLLVVDVGEAEAEALALLSRLGAAGKSVTLVALVPDARVRQAALQAGCDEVIVGPPALPELRTAVIRALSRPVLRAIPGAPDPTP